MLDLKDLRKNGQEIEKKLKTKDPAIDLSSILRLDEKLRSLKTELDSLKAKKNLASKEIGELKRKKENADSLTQEVGRLNAGISSLETSMQELELKVHHELACLPNIPLDEIPVSPSPKDNVCIKEFGQKPSFSFPFKNHVELNEKLKFFDFARSTKISGSGFVLYRDQGARLEWALLNYMLDIHRKNGFLQIIPPILAKPDILFGSAHLPKFESQLFRIHDQDHQLFLVPTAETVINGMHIDEVLDAKDLPLYYTAYTPCFRREAGAAGSQERGLIRTHQFNKVEMFAFTKPEDGVAAFNKMMQSAEEVLQGLQIHYRNMLLTTGDMSFAAAKTVDIEVWLPGQNRYYEVSSVSYCTDFQARRSRTKFREKETLEFVHTLNGSGLATSRLMVAILENFQQEDGSVLIPKVLEPYLESGNEAFKYG